MKLVIILKFEKFLLYAVYSSLKTEEHKTKDQKSQKLTAVAGFPEHERLKEARIQSSQKSERYQIYHVLTNNSLLGWR